jgi:hypothetical protein
VTSPSIGADFAGAKGASAPAQFLQRGLSPLTYDAARDGRGGREGKGGEGKEGEAEGRDIQLKASRRLCHPVMSLLNTGNNLNDAAGVASQ